MTPDEFRRIGHQLIDWIAEYREGLPKRAVMAQVKPGAIRAQLPTAPPAQGEPLDAMLADLDRVVMPGITHWNHPRFFAYFPSNSSLAAVLAELVTAGLGVQGMSWETSPAATEVEEVMMEWLRQACGLPETFTGVIQDAASTSTLVALLCARERSTQYAQERDGNTDGLIVYASDQAHSSVEKAALLAGIGRERIRAIPTDAQHALIPEQLAAAIDADLKRNLKPCAVIGTIGSTSTTAVDPLAPIAAIAERHQLWFHVDAALAGSAMILPEKRALFAGIEKADSIVFNPHKWLGTTFDLSAYYLRDPAHLIRVMSTHPSYLKTAHDAEVRNLRDWGIPLGRRFRALKLWFLLRSEGLEGLRARLRRDLDNAQWLAETIRATPEWEVVAPVSFQTVVVRHRPHGLKDGDALNAHNAKWCDALNRSGAAYLTRTMVKGHQLVRISIGAEGTQRSDVEALWALMQSAAANRDIL